MAGLLDRLDHMLSYHAMYGTWQALGERLTPAEVFTRNFWFCAVEDQSSFVQRDRIGVGQHHARSRLPALRLDVAAHPADHPRTRSAICPRT